MKKLSIFKDLVRITFAVLAVTVIGMCMSSCATIKGAVGDTIGMQTLSLEEVIAKSKEVPCEYDKDLYYKGLKIGTIEPWSVGKNILSPIESRKIWDSYTAFLKANNAWDERSVEFMIVAYDKKTKTSRLVQSKTTTRLMYITKAFSLDGKHQATVLMYQVPLCIKERLNNGSEVVSYDDVYYFIDEANSKISAPVRKQPDMIPYIQEFRDIMKIVVEKETKRFPAAKPQA